MTKQTKVNIARTFIDDTNGIFSCRARKRSTGEIRTFNARRLADEQYEDCAKRDRDNDMYTIMEMNSLQRGEGKYRTIALENVIELRSNGKRITFE